jgi:hypothetical protein
VDYADSQTGLSSGLALERVHQGIALGAFRPVSSTLPQVDRCGAFPAIDDWHVAMMLAWPGGPWKALLAAP